MAKKHKKHKRHGGHHPTAKAKKAYNQNIIKAYRRLHAVVKKHNPYELLDA
jgi:hypothetical protein